MKKQYILLLAALLLCAVPKGIAQEYLELLQNPKANTTLQEVQQLAETYFANKDLGRGSGYKQYKRWEYKMERMVNEDGLIRKNFNRMTLDAALEANAIDLAGTNSRMAGWTDLGPTSYTNGSSGYNGGLGRVNVVGFHPTDGNTIYVGTPAGGLWKSTNGGSSWNPMTDALASIGVSGIAVDHSAPETVYILTGDGDGGDTRSIGVMKSMDGGATWASTGLSWNVTQNFRGYKLLMHPTDSNTMLVVTNGGIYKTTDGWNTSSNVRSGSFRDIEFKPGDPSVVYAVTGNTFYRSTDTGSTWAEISTGLPSGETRIALAVSPANPNYVYYLAGPSLGTGSFRGIFRSTDSGVSFSLMTATPNILGYATNGNDDSDQSWYDLAMAVNPSNAENIITGGINVWRSTNGGASLNAVSKWNEPTGSFEYVHADIHELAYNPVDGKLYVGSDGGVSVSSDNGQTFTNIWDGLQIMQFYRIAGVPSNPNLLIGGSQDNGSNVYSGSTTIQHIYGADGMDCMIDYNNPNTVYFAVQNGNFRKSNNGGNTSFSIRPSGSSGSWVTPYGMDATNPDIIYGGFTDVYRSTNGGSSWTNLGSNGTGALAIGVDDPARLYAASGSSIEMSSNTGGSWTNITGPWPSLTITFIAVDPADARKVWVTLGGYTAGQKVYESTDAGSTWTNVSGTLPNMPAYSIAYENTGGAPMDALYVGMAVGVYYKSDVTPWQLHETGLPNTPVYDLEINETNGKIVAGTFGRGLWEAPLFVNLACDVAISDVTATDTSCPGSTDGTVTVTATCSDCTGIDYTLTPTAPAGPPITQTDNGVFAGLAANSYTVTAANNGDPSCSVAWGSNPIVVNEGSETVVPTIACPGEITQTADAGSCSAVVTYTPPVGTDNCPGATTIQTAGLASGSAFPVGTTINTFEVTDTSGNTASCSFNVVVTDDQMPMAVCQDITVQLDASGSASIVASDVDGGSSDNCSIASSSIDITSFDCSNVGTNNVVLTVTDPAGNTSNCTAIVTVEDMILPSAICQDITIQLDGSGMATITAADIDGGSSDACGIDTTAIDVSTFDCSNIGTNNVTLTVTDMNGNMNSCVAVVTVEDVEVPDALCQDITVQLDASGMASIVATDVDGGSTDNCGTPTLAIDMNTFDCSDVGVNDVTLTVTDANGNVNSCIAEVTVEDSVAPMAVCQDITVQLDASGTVVITAADVDGGSSDACGVDSISIDMDTFDCSNVGTNDVTLTVLDVNGNTATCIAVVTVEEENATPVAVCQDITVPIQADGTATITPEDVDAGSSGMGCIDGMTLDIDTFDCSDIGTPIQVTLMITNGNGDIDTCTALVNIVDSVAPVIECPEDQTVASEGPYTVPDYFDMGMVAVTDNCEGSVMASQQPAPGTMLDFGSYNITITVADPSGNEDTCIFRLTVEDALGVATPPAMSSLLVYPNPAQEEFVLANPRGISLNDLQMYDITGRLVKTIPLQDMGIEARVDLSELASASYILIVTSDEGHIVKHLLKE
tara:strand:+ start:49349 stop:53875 length:4527 start_codon:yes stop_codon:yes gene_type:complete